MSRTPIQFPAPKSPEPPVPGATQGPRIIFGIGGQRFAVDFYRKITELNPEPAHVLSMERTKTPKGQVGKKDDQV